MPRLKRILLTIMASFGLIAPAAMPVTVFAADTSTGLCQGANLQVGNDECEIDEAAATNSINDIIETVINIFSLVVGVVAVIMIIVGGLKYITYGGDSGNITGAKNTILYAVVGLVVVALAQIIVRFVLTEATPADTGI